MPATSSGGKGKHSVRDNGGLGELAEPDEVEGCSAFLRGVRRRDTPALSSSDADGQLSLRSLCKRKPIARQGVFVVSADGARYGDTVPVEEHPVNAVASGCGSSGKSEGRAGRFRGLRTSRNGDREDHGFADALVVVEVWLPPDGGWLEERR